MLTLTKNTMALLLLGHFTTAHAHFYVDAGGGGVFSNTKTSYIKDSSSVIYSPTAIGTSLFTLPNVNWRNQFKNGFDIYAALGYRFDKHWHSDIEFLYQNIERHNDGHYGWKEQYVTTGAIYAEDDDNVISKTGKQANVYSFLANGTYDFKNQHKWFPLLGGGVGVAWLKSDRAITHDRLDVHDPSTPLTETAPATQRSPSLHGTAFAWQLKAGIGYEVSDSKTVTLQYRLFGTTHFKSSNSVIISNPGTADAGNFYIAGHDIRGLLSQAVEINLSFDV